MQSCKACGEMYIPSDIIVIEEIPIEKGGGFVHHNFGKDDVCSDCRSAAFADDDYEDMFEDKWVKPIKYEKYRE